MVFVCPVSEVRYEIVDDRTDYISRLQIHLLLTAVSLAGVQLIYSNYRHAY